MKNWILAGSLLMLVVLSSNLNAANVKKVRLETTDNAIGYFKKAASGIDDNMRGVVATEENCRAIVRDLREGAVLSNRITSWHDVSSDVQKDVRRALDTMQTATDAIFVIIRAGINCGVGIPEETNFDLLRHARKEIYALKYYKKCYLNLSRGTACQTYKSYTPNRKSKSLK